MADRKRTPRSSAGWVYFLTLPNSDRGKLGFTSQDPDQTPQSRIPFLTFLIRALGVPYQAGKFHHPEARQLEAALKRVLAPVRCFDAGTSTETFAISASRFETIITAALAAPCLATWAKTCKL